MNNEQLAAAVAKVKELDAKRTQGEWAARAWRENDTNCYTVEGSGYHIVNTLQYTPEKENAEFIAYSTQMATIITQLWNERQALSPLKDYTWEDVALAVSERDALKRERQAMLEVLARVGDGLEHCRPDHVTQPLIKAIDAVLNQRSE